MIRLVVCDIDGTLVGPDELLSDDVLLMKQQLEEKGILFSVATGRVECMAEKFVTKLQLQIPYVACNGATVVQGNNVFRRLQFHVSPLQEFIHKADEMGLSIIYSVNGKEYAWRDAPYILSQRKRFNRYNETHTFTETEWRDLLVDKVTIMSDRDDAIAILEKMCASLGNEIGFTRYLDQSIELVNKNATKASGVEFLTGLLHIPMTNVMFIGDHQNDIELINAAGIGVAVGNSTGDVKASADYVCKNSLSLGVREAVNHFLFQGAC